MRLLPCFALSIPLALSACAEDSAGDVVGPFTGATHRFVVDRIDLPLTYTLARDSGGDLDGDGNVDNQLGMAVALLNEEAGDLNEHGPDMIASGVIASSVEIIADDLSNDPTVSVVFHGADRDGGHPMGGRLSNGVFISNRTARSHVLGTATFHMPLWDDADPAVFEIDNV